MEYMRTDSLQMVETHNTNIQQPKKPSKDDESIQHFRDLQNSTRFSSRSGHRRTQSALDERQILPSNLEVASLPTVASHGIEVAVVFKPVEHPVEPLDYDQPVQCPLPEPSILNDGRIWKERLSASARKRPDLPVMTEGVPLESEVGEIKVRQPQSKRSILPSASAPEHSLLKLLEECNTSGM